jgi:hypothetical protein
MDTESALRKLFAKLDVLDDVVARLESLERRLAELDTNGKLGEIERQMKTVAANSQVVISTVESHGTVLEKLSNRLRRLDLRCPLLKPPTEELKKVSSGAGGV